MENEILIENKLSENMSNRVVIIHEDGQLDVVASLKDKGTQYHIKYFQAYLEQRYLDDQTLQTYAKTATEPSTIIYLLLKIKEILFLQKLLVILKKINMVFYIYQIRLVKNKKKR